MKKLILYLIFSLIFILSGCDDGKDGQAYLKFWWTGSLSYFDNNPEIPNTFYSDFYYAVSPGTYSFDYISWDSSSWYGTYTITREDGESGILPFIDGADGEDSYFELGLYSSGPTFYSWGSTAANTAGKSQILLGLTEDQKQERYLSENEVNELKKNNYSLFPSFNLNSGDIITEEIIIGKYKMILRFTKI